MVSRPYRISLICGLVPLLTGTVVFIAWWVTRDSGLMAVGSTTILWGLALFLIGFVSLAVYVRKARITQIEKWRLKAFVAGSILLANFPVAATYIIVAIYLNGTYTIIVNNVSATAIDQLTLLDPVQSRYEFGPVAVNEQREEKFLFSGEGPVMYELSFDNYVRSDVLIGYISFGLGGCVLFTIDDKGTSNSSRCF